MARLALPRIREIVKFGSVGLATNAIDYAIFTCLILLAQTAPLYAHMASYSTAAVFSFFANRHWTFKASSASLGYQAATFIFANIIGLAASAWLVDHLSTSLTPWGAKLVSTVVLVFWFYGFSKLIIFRDRAAPPPGPARSM